MEYKLIVALLVMTISACAQNQSFTKKQIGGPCEDCQMMFDGIPNVLESKTKLAQVGEPGEPMIISGIIFKQDGKTPASGIVLYVYQTDSKGLYSKSTNQTQAIRHGHLRGWVKTNAKGEYEFKTIRPASYPNSSNPQHIHPIIYEPGKGYYWIDEYMFDDDPLLDSNERSHVNNRGGSGILKLERNSAGEWEGTRNIVLGLNVANY
ncbi:MAG: intradiol ring-cleavage dioxygenase [Cyclobacteriaceae bacterium]